MSDKATFTLAGKSHELAVRKGSIGPDVVDVSGLYRDADVFTYDPGFTATASCESKITYIDGDQGVLLYRGYPIEQLAEHGDFIETCYLLLYGELPTPTSRREFESAMTSLGTSVAYMDADEWGALWQRDITLIRETLQRIGKLD